MRRKGLSTLVVVLLALVASCGSGGDQRYSDEVRRDYLDSCAAGGNGEGYCGCTLEFFEERYTFPELEELLAAVDRSERLDEFLAVFQECG
jgi:hypothetical protein